MKKVLEIIDKLIDNIPMHIRDIIQKSMIMLVALVGLFAITIAVKKGISDAKPGGVQLFQTSRDVFYTDELTIENDNKIQLIEDVDIGDDAFIKPDARVHPDFKSMGESKGNRLMGDSDTLIKRDSILRSKSERFLDSDEENKRNLLPSVDRPNRDKSLPNIADPNDEGIIKRKEVNDNNPDNSTANNNNKGFIDETNEAVKNSDSSHTNTVDNQGLSTTPDSSVDSTKKTDSPPSGKNKSELEFLE